MIVINLMDTKKVKRKASLVLWAASLALLAQVQPVSGMEESLPEKSSEIPKAEVVSMGDTDIAADLLSEGGTHQFEKVNVADLVQLEKAILAYDKMTQMTVDQVEELRQHKENISDKMEKFKDVKDKDKVANEIKAIIDDNAKADPNDQLPKDFTTFLTELEAEIRALKDANELKAFQDAYDADKNGANAKFKVVFEDLEKVPAERGAKAKNLQKAFGKKRHNKSGNFKAKQP